MKLDHKKEISEEFSKLKEYLKGITEDYSGEEALEWVDNLSEFNKKELYSKLFQINLRIYETLKWYTPTLKIGEK